MLMLHLLTAFATVHHHQPHLQQRCSSNCFVRPYQHTSISRALVALLSAHSNSNAVHCGPYTHVTHTCNSRSYITDQLVNSVYTSTSQTAAPATVIASRVLRLRFNQYCTVQRAGLAIRRRPVTIGGDSLFEMGQHVTILFLLPSFPFHSSPLFSPPSLPLPILPLRSRL